jgi:hypothetical protein
MINYIDIVNQTSLLNNNIVCLFHIQVVDIYHDYYKDLKNIQKQNLLVLQLVLQHSSFLHKMVVEIDNVYHNMDKDMNKRNHQVDVEYIVLHLYILLHSVDNQVIFHIDHPSNQVGRNSENLEEQIDHFDMYHKYMDF